MFRVRYMLHSAALWLTQLEGPYFSGSVRRRNALTWGTRGEAERAADQLRQCLRDAGRPTVGVEVVPDEADFTGGRG